MLFYDFNQQIAASLKPNPYFCCVMANICSFLKHFAVKTARFRHRNGYGVHSPFAYNLIKGVIYQSHPYYAYRELGQIPRSAPADTGVSERLDKLMFRLVNYTQPHAAALIGSNTATTAAYMAAGCRKATVEQLNGTSSLPTKQYDLCYAAPDADFLAAFTRFAPKAGPNALFVAAGIRRSPAARRAWAEITGSPLAIVTFDIYEAGLVFFNRELNKQHYVISF